MFFNHYIFVLLLTFVFYSGCSSKNSRTAHIKDGKVIAITDSNFLHFLNNFHNKYKIEVKLDNFIRINEIVKKQIEKPYVNENFLIESLKVLAPNENLGIYQMKSFESLYLLNQITLMHLLMGNPDKARVSTMQTIKRMELINNFDKREKENLNELMNTPFSSLKKSIYLKDSKKKFKHINPENEKKFANYLNGLVFEINNEKNLSDFAYELAGFKNEKASRQDVIVITEYSEIDPIQSETLIFDDEQYFFTMNIPFIDRTIVNVNAFENKNCDQFLFEDYNLKLAYQLDHEMNKFLIRSFIKLGLQSYLIVSLDEIDESGTLGSLASLFFLFGNKVDIRHWSKMPSHLSVCRFNATNDHINIQIHNKNRKIEISKGLNVVYIKKNHENAAFKTVVYN